MALEHQDTSTNFKRHPNSPPSGAKASPSGPGAPLLPSSSAVRVPLRNRVGRGFELPLYARDTNPGQPPNRLNKVNPGTTHQLSRWVCTLFFAFVLLDAVCFGDLSGLTAAACCKADCSGYTLVVGLTSRSYEVGPRHDTLWAARGLILGSLHAFSLYWRNPNTAAHSSSSTRTMIVVPTEEVKVE